MGTKKAKCHAHEFHHRHVSSRLVSSAGCLCHEQCISTSPIVTTSPSSALPSCHPLDCAKLTCLNSKTHHNHVHVDLRARGCHRFSNPFTACSCVSLKPLHSSARLPLDACLVPPGSIRHEFSSPVLGDQESVDGLLA